MGAAETRRFGIWLDRTMTNRDLTGTELAHASGVDEGSISRWRHGKAPPGLSSCERLADALGVDPRRLAKTAGQLPPRMSPGVERFSLPPATGDRSRLRKLLLGAGVSEVVAEAMLDAFDVATAREDDDEA